SCWLQGRRAWVAAFPGGGCSWTVSSSRVGPLSRAGAAADSLRGGAARCSLMSVRSPSPGWRPRRAVVAEQEATEKGPRAASSSSCSSSGSSSGGSSSSSSGARSALPVPASPHRARAARSPAGRGSPPRTPPKCAREQPRAPPQYRTPPKLTGSPRLDCWSSRRFAALARRGGAGPAGAG
ncbi:unnamed protein product, partial [Prorocentrum cordatum]